MQKITPHLWFATEAVEAAQFYVNLFGRGSKITHQAKLSGTPSGEVDVVSFELWGFRFDAISAGPYVTPTPAISFSVQTHDEEETDRLYNALKEGGKELMPLGSYGWSKKYGWVNDKYGFSWQINWPADDHAYGDRIAPSLLFTQKVAGKAEDALTHYTRVFPESSTRFIARYEKGEHDTEGFIKHAEFVLCGQTFMALDSSAEHTFTFNEGVSLLVRCDTQEEIDAYWEALSADKNAEQCGWLKDAYGVSWQIVPASMDRMMQEGTPEQRARVTKAFLAMKKFDVAQLEQAFNGE